MREAGSAERAGLASLKEVVAALQAGASVRARACRTTTPRRGGLAVAALLSTPLPASDGRRGETDEQHA